ncbi:MAG TPA: FtsQ-type POTRA domain-containing protein [Candidatus Wildermuthbacteria bacterium]|nr:FtsQ-type POTRA domain-containing protein [Candidatus Wildermuthbacteria bacterium]
MERRFRKPYRIQKKRYWYKNKAMWFVIAALAFVVLFVYLLWFLPFLQVKEVEVVGDESISSERVVAITKEKISQNILGFKSSTILFVGKSAVSEALQDSFPSVESASVRKSFPSKIIVTISLRQEIISWCKLAEEDKVCVAVDRFGIAFKDASFSDLYITGPPELQDIVWGDRIIDPELLSKLLDLRTEAEPWSVLREDGVTIVEFAIISENWVHVVSSEGWAAYINPKENLDWQLTKLKLVLEREVPQEKRGELLYLDLRFGDQAFIKYQGE